MLHYCNVSWCQILWVGLYYLYCILGVSKHISQADFSNTSRTSFVHPGRHRAHSYLDMMQGHQQAPSWLPKLSKFILSFYVSMILTSTFCIYILIKKIAGKVSRILLGILNTEKHKIRYVFIAIWQYRHNTSTLYSSLESNNLYA